MPQWSTPERRDHLVGLWSKYGNRCLHGHYLCPIRDHYVHVSPMAIETVTDVRLVPCYDANGNRLKDSHGNEIHRKQYTIGIERVYATEHARLYDVKESELVAHWIADDREARHYEQAAQRRILHHIPERGALRGTFNAISRDIYFDSQPDYYVEGIGVSGLTQRPFAKVRLPSSFTRLHVDITDAMKGMSKNQRRKAKRYANALPVPVQVEVERACRAAVKDYRSR